GHFETGQSLGRKCAQLVQRETGPRLEGHDRFNRLAPLLIGHTHHRHLGHRRVFEQHALDLGRVHVFAAGDDHVFDAVADVIEPTRVEVTDVARVEPVIVADRVARCFGLVPIASGHVHATYTNLTTFP